MELQIDKNMPIPKTKKSLKYPFAEMETGDSFFVECNEESSRKKTHLVSNLHTCAKNSRTKNIKITTRIEENGVRCWRIA